MNSIDGQGEQEQNSTEILRTEAKKQVARYIRRKYAGNKLAFIDGDVYSKVQEPYRQWTEQGNQLDTDDDYRGFIKFVKILALNYKQHGIQ